MEEGNHEDRTHCFASVINGDEMAICADDAIIISVKLSNCSAKIIVAEAC